MEKEPMMSPEEIAKNQTSRILSDAEILKRKEGEYVPGTEESDEPRLEVTKDFIDGGTFTRGARKEMVLSISEQEKERREAVIERDSKVDLRELVKSNSELASKIECIDSGWDNDIFIVKVKKFPETGIIVHPGPSGRDFRKNYSDGTVLHFNYTDEQSPKRTVFKKVESPVPRDIVTVDGKTFREREIYEKDNSEFQKVAKEVVDHLVEIAREHGIKTMIIRQGDDWAGWGMPEIPDHVFEIMDSRWDETFEGKMGMPDFETHDHAHLSSKEGGYETDKEYPVFDWTRYH